jgi:type II secretory ATPase GspE/PulE/Tfp pilus assembly ATPase PilB-like protein
MSNAPKPAPDVVLPPIKFTADGPTAEIREANLEAVLPAPGYPTMALIIADALVKRADVVLLDYTVNSVAVRYQIDGMWHHLPAIEREAGDFMLAALKRLANLDIQERRARQQGTFSTEFLKKRFRCRIVSQGVATGERVAIYLERTKPPLETLEECGMRPALVEKTKLILQEPHGFFLVSGLPGDGFTTSWRATLNATDRFMRDYFVIEDLHKKEPEIINVTSVAYDSKKQQDPTSILGSLLLREPHAIALNELVNGRVLDTFCDLANRDNKQIVGRIHAKSCIDAVLRVLALKPTFDKFATALIGVVCHRLIRKLCDQCKRPYQPSPQLLAQLGLPPGRIAKLFEKYEPRPEELVDAQGRPIPYEPCTACGGVGFMERTAIYELLVVNDAFRDAVRSDPRPDHLMEVAREGGFVTMREEGILLTARGIVSVDELRRVLSK